MSGIGGRHALVCQIVKVDRVRVANICPLRVTRIAIISPCISSSAAVSNTLVFSVVAPSAYPVPLVPSDTNSGSVRRLEESSGSSGRSCDCWPRIPSWETTVRSGFVCLVAANTEGDEMGQYVMALFWRLLAAFARVHLTAGWRNPWS